MKSWLLIRQTGDLYRIINNTGQDACNVTFAIKGAMVGGNFGDPRWSHTVDVIQPNAGIEEVFAKAFGSGQAITVEWSEPSGQLHNHLIPFD